MTEAKEVESLKDIDTNSIEGKLLVASMAILTVDVYPTKTPDEVLNKLKKLSAKIYAKKING